MLEEKPRRSVNFQFTRPRMPNMYASGVCSGKITPGGKKKRKKAMGGGVMRDVYAGGGLARRKRGCA